MSSSTAILMTSAQQAIWYAQQLSPDVPFTIAYYVDLRGDVDLDVLAACTTQAHREFGSTTACFDDQDDGIPMQRSGPDRMAVSIVDLRASPKAASAADQWMSKDCLTPIPLTSDCLVQSAILRITDDRCYWYTRAHHIALDGYGAMMVLRRTAELFMASTTGSEASPVEPMSPSDTVAVDRRYLSSPRYERDSSYWSSVHSELRLPPTLTGRTGAPSPSPLRHGGEIPNSIALESNRWTERGTNTSTVVIAAFAVLLARLTDSADTALSLPVAGRPTARLRRSAGTHSNVVPLALSGIGATTVDGAVKLTEIAITAALRHQLFQSVYGLSGTHARGPVVNVMLFDDHIPLGTIDGEIHILTTGPVADIALDIHPGRPDAQWRWGFEANPAIYSNDDVTLLGARLLHVLRQFMQPDNHDVDIADLDIRHPDEVDLPPQSGRPASETDTLPALLTRSIPHCAERIAIRYHGHDMSYGELDARSRSLAAAIAERGIGVGSVVAVMLPRSAESVIATWAVARSGATYLPIDSSLPATRIEYLLTDAAVALVLCTDAAKKPAVAHGIPMMDVLQTDESRTMRSLCVHPFDAAYIIYTSGTTGSPKGVSVTHAGLGPLVTQMNDAYRLTEDSRVLHFASPSFDTALVEMLAAATAGCTLVLSPPNIVGGHELSDFLTVEAITHLFTTPSVLATLAPGSLAALDVVITGGEPCPQRLADELSAQVTLFNAYGPTETTCSVTMTDAMTPGWPVSIGAPMRGVDALVLDRNLAPRPVASSGELYISSAAVARGYIGRPAETASRFVADPCGRPGRRMYRTGDVVRWRPDGSLDFIGRTDGQIEFRGVRIEPSEIDAALCRYGPVLQAATVIAEVSQGYSILASYVVAKPFESIDPTQARAFVADLLPDFMVPAAVTVLDHLPLTANRKVNTRELPPPDLGRESLIFEPPCGAEELDLAKIFSAVLSRDSIDANTSFFDLGGDSLSATRVVGRINSQMGVAVGVRDLVANPTIRLLAAALPGLTASSTSRPTPGASDNVAVIPLAPAQADIDRTTDVPLYNLPFTIEVNGPFDIEALELSIGDVLERHQSLRTVYQGSRQVVRPIVDAHLLLTECDTMASLLSLLRDGFDVGAELPIRFAYVKSPRNRLVVGCCVHHIAADGWSLGVLARDMLHAYSQRSIGAPPTWGPLPLQYTDYALWAQSSANPSDLEYWRSELAGCPSELPLPFDYPRPAVASLRAGRRAARVEEPTVRRLSDVAAAHGTGLFTAIRAALVVTLARTTGTTDIVIGTPTAGRSDPLLDDLVGMFVNTVALRTDTSAAESISDVLRLCHDAEVRALDHPGVQFEELVRLLQPPRPNWAHPFFQVALSFDTFVAMDIDTPALNAEIVPRPIDIARCALHIHVAASASTDGHTTSLVIDVVYSRDLFDDHTVTILTDRFVAVLAEFSTDLSAPLALLAEK